MFYRMLSLVFLFVLASATRAETKPLSFRLSFSPRVSPAPFTGRVFVMLTKSDSEPRLGPNWFNPGPFFARDVKDWKPGEPLVVAADALSFPEPLAQLPKAMYSVQAVMDFDRGERTVGTGAGNGYSKVVRRELDAATTGPVELVIDQVVPAPKFRETERVKEINIESRLLTAFHKRPVRLRAGVVLPESYAANPQKRYPTLYVIPGFGGTHFGAAATTSRSGTLEMIRVVLDPSCRLGHHVFADSDNNGPCGRALTEELIPHLEKEYRALAVPTARFLTGHSSGGWSSLWLQVAYPDFFGGVWSTAPDPVDFRDFSAVNLYEPNANLYTDAAGKPRPVGRRGGKPILFMKPFSQMEDVLGHGGQLSSFEAVFGPRGPDGKPQPLWDRATGKINPEVARSWERYDIRLVLERNWEDLGPRLAGKIHVYMGTEDNFYLNGAVVLLKAALARRGSDAVVELFPGRDHGSLMDAKLRERIAKEMAEQFQKHHK